MWIVAIILVAVTFGLLSPPESARAQTAQCLLFSDFGEVGYQVDVANGALTQVTIEQDQPPASEPDSTGQTLSPSGDWRFTIERPDRASPRRILTLENAQTGQQRLFTFESYETVYGSGEAMGSPDGQRIALSYALAMDGDELLTLLSVPDLTPSAVDPGLPSFAMSWSPSGRYLLLQPWGEGGDFVIIDTVNADALPISRAAIPGFYNSSLPIFWSPDETYVVVYHSSGDIWTAFTVFDVGGNVTIDGFYVPSSGFGFSPSHAWLDDHHLLVEELTIQGFYALAFFDAAAGTREEIETPYSTSAITPDLRLIAVSSSVGTTVSAPAEARRIRFYEFSGEAYHLTRAVLFPDVYGIGRMLWLADGGELIVLSGHNILYAYDFANRSWRQIRALEPELGESLWWMEQVPCQPASNP